MTRFERIAYKIGIIAVVIYVIAMAAIATAHACIALVNLAKTLAN